MHCARGKLHRIQKMSRPDSVPFFTIGDHAIVENGIWRGRPHRFFEVRVPEFLQFLHHTQQHNSHHTHYGVVVERPRCKPRKSPGILSLLSVSAACSAAMLRCMVNNPQHRDTSSHFIFVANLQQTPIRATRTPPPAMSINEKVSALVLIFLFVCYTAA